MFAQVTVNNSDAMSSLLASIWSVFTWGGYLGGAVILLLLSPWLLGMVMIDEKEVGVVIKKFGFAKLPPGQLIALNGEAGYQADTLAPGLHFGYWFFQYRVIKVGDDPYPGGRNRSRAGECRRADCRPSASSRSPSPCDNFQDARAFLINGGEKGRQLAILTAGTYRINTALFTVITAATASHYGLTPNQLYVYAGAVRRGGHRHHARRPPDRSGRNRRRAGARP